MIETLNAWWPFLALPVTFAVGFGAGFLMWREDMIQARAELKRRAAAFDEMAAEALGASTRNEALIATVETYRRDWQAMRAIVDQHTVKEKV